MNVPQSIVFVCLHGSAKSLIAAEYLNRQALAHGLALRASSAGVEPDAKIPPHVVAGLREKGFDVAGRAPVPVGAAVMGGADRIITFGCDLPGPAPHLAVEQWADCPAVSDDFAAAWTYITSRVDRMLGIGVALAAMAMGANAQTLGFDHDPPGAPPPGWTCGVTGKGAPRWSVERDATAPSAPHVLKQTGSGTFPWCVRQGISILDGFVEVKFKPLAGREDQAGGVVWRWTDGNSYYVARANALEDNVSLYYTEGGRRNTIKYVDAPVAREQWHLLRTEFAGGRIRVSLDGKVYIDVVDTRIRGPGTVGVWTKSDSVTAFDDFSFGPAK